MIRGLRTLVVGVLIAALVLVVASVAAVYVIGLATKAALFGEPRASLAVKIFQRLTDNTRITHNSGGERDD